MVISGIIKRAREKGSFDNQIWIEILTQAVEGPATPWTRLLQGQSPERADPGASSETSSRPTAKAAAAVVGGALAVVAVPTVLGAMGFTGAGIAASSLAAKMMSSAAIANGGGVAAGSLVATLQSVGSAGLSLSSRVLLGSAGFALVSLVVGL
ncbi:interferon alpha-inducible protein 27, mitochondrial-like [Balaenoptera acutorostrata]|uniref:Interferon alpha-inducible protein 27, mitochondrial-like n=1 Tax=Balaenoptera acutorostrata TaxID=9767 RepID=A0ABM3T9B3_BALAC|nr:interferon alpha-inducible protein 27, mitochondrial-like [Balaenoptera acutorostrata]